MYHSRDISVFVLYYTSRPSLLIHNYYNIFLQCQFNVASTVRTLGSRVTVPIDVVMHRLFTLSDSLELKYGQLLHVAARSRMGQEHSPLEEIVRFPKNPSQYEPLEDEKLFFEALSLAQMSCTNFAQALCKVIDFSPMDLSRVQNLSNEIKRLIRNTLAHPNKVMHGKCTICKQCVARSPLPTALTHCCQQKVHEACWNDPDLCQFCSEPFHLLPCCHCDRKMEYFGPLVKGYEFYSALRLGCMSQAY